MRLFSKKDSKELVFMIDGMHCSMCSANLERGLKETEGVLKASVNFETRKAEILYDVKKTNPDKLEQAVKEIGYSVVK